MELPTGVCTQCGQSKVKIRDGSGWSGGAIFVDASGITWGGKTTCPDCMEDRRQQQKSRTQTCRPPKPPRRLCRRCQKKLPASRYFYHSGCSGEESLDLSQYSSVIVDVPAAKEHYYS